MNILMIVVDEWRYPVPYESEKLKQWRKDNLKFYNMLSEKGTVFHRHYTNTNACVPARTTLHTGVYPSIHGNISTDAVAKHANDKEMHWLKPYTVPTIGNYLQQNGYRTFLKGKWHISNASIRGESNKEIPTFDFNGQRISEMEQFYLQKNVLHPYGYEGWIGPEPHGKVALNSASSLPSNKIGRDENFVNQTLETLDDLKTVNCPWFLNLNLVDPHDIVLYGKLASKLEKVFNFTIDETLPDELFHSDFINSYNEDLSSKPETQIHYKNMYENIFQPLFDINTHIKYYYTLMKRADEQLIRIWNKLVEMPYFNNTTIIFTADHGDLLGSHGGMQQKWYQAYEEAIHVPLIIWNPRSRYNIKHVYELTSHIDILPTILDLANINGVHTRNILHNTFSLAIPLSGKSLLPCMFNDKHKTSPVYFYTEDNIFSGQRQQNILGKKYSDIKEPSCVEAIICYINNTLWKFTNYYTLENFYIGQHNNILKNELYNLTTDPLELHNLYNNILYTHIQKYLNELLAHYSFRYREIANINA